MLHGCFSKNLCVCACVLELCIVARVISVVCMSTVVDKYPVSKRTSYLFLTNAAHVWWRGCPWYAMASVWLAYTSVRLRRCFPRRPEDVYMDYVAIGLYITQGAYHWRRIMNVSVGYHSLIASTFVIDAILYRRRCDLLTYESRVDVYEASVHMVASMGHHLIAWRL